MSQRAKLIFAIVVLAIGCGWMYHTWQRYQPIREEPREAERRLRQERTRPARNQADLSPEQRIAQQHRALYRRLDLSDEQRGQARAIEQRLQSEGEYRERDFRREFREILTPEQVSALNELLAERRDQREARQRDP